MDSEGWVIPLAKAALVDEQRIGGKAAQLARLHATGFQVVPGFCITVAAYEQFLQANQLPRTIQMELGRKPFEELRWEELWDAALRIRNRFSESQLPADVERAVCRAVRELGTGTPLAVRSSAPGEDSVNRSFAGLHESFLHVVGEAAVLESVRLVWASLWSDAALLYRQELALDALHSRMAVLVQEMRIEDRSGVAFGRDPRTEQNDNAVIEAVPGPCCDLVDGSVAPDQWLIHRGTRRVVHFTSGQRDGDLQKTPLLEQEDLESLLAVLDLVEDQLGWCPDVEWTGRSGRLTILQARPITRVREDPDDKRPWYLSLRPDQRRLQQLGHRVAEQLIPELRALGDRLAAEPVEEMIDAELADGIESRLAQWDRWKQIYADEFIPFAHGVRYLGLYYNDAVHPTDPYEFVGLLRGEEMLASRRNRSLQALAQQVRRSPSLREALQQIVRELPAFGGDAGGFWADRLSGLAEGVPFVEAFQALARQFLDVAFGGHRLIDEPTPLLRNILELASKIAAPIADGESHETPEVVELEQRLLDAVGVERRDEAREVMRLARLSWQLRDDDNLLVARVESQLLRALHVAGDRLKAAGKLNADAQVGSEAAEPICTALREPHAEPLFLPAAKQALPHPVQRSSGDSPRQLVGQPAAHGLASGNVRLVRGPQDLGSFQAGEVLVCDAIQPMMTHLVPLAAAVVERRGGMLIHGAIIARELGIPCVNGVAHVVDLLQDGQYVTVDGYLGIVTLGAPEFNLEHFPG
jgi:phosphohistidine swiveling domain-containing protein